MLKGHLECESIVKAAPLLFHAVLIVAYVIAVSLPTQSAFIIRLYFRIHQRLHALVVATLGFDEVDDVEFIGNVLSSVLDLEEEPLGVIIGPVVILKNEIILKLPDLDSAAEVS